MPCSISLFICSCAIFSFCRLQDILTNLKNKLKKQEKNYRDENVTLTEEYKRITEQFKELQKKSKYDVIPDVPHHSLFVPTISVVRPSTY